MILQVLALAVTLWPKLPESMVTACSLLPGSGGEDKRTEAFFTRKHLETLTETLKATTNNHPHLHIVWKVLLPMLLPGVDFSGAR